MTPNDSPSAALVQLQALSILYDFLIDEERRVNIAAMADAAQQRQQQHSTICSELDIANNDAVFSSNKNDLNSGMATWVLQQFHTHVLGLFSTSCSQAVRERAFNIIEVALYQGCLLYTSDAADEEDSVDLGGRRIIKKKNKKRLRAE
eukprot:TRINITY_DN20611_c0_g1_i4.p1 TRINITY_DN20611_c0_g1~~TRINITY_DN20611_c0_g1_i4.p1  ORF type:complete len:148 (-),score=44.92 TRINITY_DN20611_c0_g1_i4:59-502(-)